MPRPTPPPATKPTPTEAVDTSKRYDEALKRQAVENWIRSGNPGTLIARELGLSYPSLKEWKRRYWGDTTRSVPIWP